MFLAQNSNKHLIDRYANYLGLIFVPYTLYEVQNITLYSMSIYNYCQLNLFMETKLLMTLPILLNKQFLCQVFCN